MLRSLFAKHYFNNNNNNNNYKRIVANSINQFYTHNSSTSRNISIFSNHFSTFLVKNNIVTLNNFKSLSELNNKINKFNFNSFSTSEIDIKSEIVHVKAQAQNVGIKIEAIESQLKILDGYTKDELKEKNLSDEKNSLNKQLESLQIQLQLWIDKLPKGINIYLLF
jgi:hypothetical protein